MEVKFPDIHVDLSGADGNAFSIIAKVTKAMRRANIDQSEIDDFTKKATDGDYNHLIQTTMITVDVS